MSDTLDHKLDFSWYLMDMHGFIPWPSIISEPALGDFGVAMALVFISPSASEKAKANYSFPDITGVGGLWTLNDSWGVAAFRQGSFPKIGMRYRVVLGRWRGIPVSDSTTVQIKNGSRHRPRSGPVRLLYRLRTLCV